jgi:hypothetical protein
LQKSFTAFHICFTTCATSCTAQEAALIWAANLRKKSEGGLFSQVFFCPRSEPQGVALYGFLDEIATFFPHQRFSAAKL